MKIDLTGVKVLVTGGSRGIGAALCKGLMAAGAQVAVHCHRNREAAQALVAGNLAGSAVFQADLGQAAACRKLVREVVDLFGGLDVLVNNAGIALKAPTAVSDEEWDAVWAETMAVNLTAVGILSREAIKAFSHQGGGRLIHVSSRAAFRGDTPDYLAYAASKAGMVALHRSIARGFGKVGVKSFLLAPGFVRTDMAQDFMDEYGEAYALQGVALDRLTEPEDLVGIVNLLASGLADHATGSTIDINAASYVH